MSITNYGNLKTTIQRWLDRNDEATINMIPDFIYLAEKQIQKAIMAACPEVPSLENEVEIEVYPYTDFIDMPADMGRIKYLYLPEHKIPLKVTSYPELLDMTFDTSGDIPRHYARHIRRIYFRPIPKTVETINPDTGMAEYETVKVRIVYIRDPIVFQNDTDSSYFLTTCPEIVLYGALAYGYDFIKDLENKQLSEQKMMMGMMDFIGQLKAEDIPDTKAYSTPDEADGISMHAIYPYM